MKYNQGKDNPMWGKRHSKETRQRMSEALLERKGGYRLSGGGYPMFYMPDHPRANIHGCVLESHLEAEGALGRCLKDDEVVHHNNGDRFDNRHSNLLICTASYHMWLHAKMRRRL